MLPGELGSVYSISGYHSWKELLESKWKVKVRDASGVLLCTGQFPGTKNDLATVLLLKKPAREENTVK